MKNHYVYRITNVKLRKHYYGVRSSDKIPELDLGYIYFSSSSDKEFIKDQKKNRKHYKYKVIKKCNTREEAIMLEIFFHNKFNVGLNEHFYNKSKQISSGWTNNGGYKWNKKSKARVKGVTTYRDSKGKGIRLPNDDPRVVSGEFVCYNKGISYSDNIELIEIRSKAIKGSKNPSASKINIYNNSNELMYECYGNFFEVCKDNNLPFSALRTSYTKGTKVYENSPKHTITKLKGLGIYQFKGWYAIKE